MFFSPLGYKAVIDERPLNVSFRKLALQKLFGGKQVLITHPLDDAANALAPTLTLCRFPPKYEPVHDSLGFVLIPRKGRMNQRQVAVLPISGPASVISPHQTVAVYGLFFVLVFGIHSFDADI